MCHLLCNRLKFCLYPVLRKNLGGTLQFRNDGTFKIVQFADLEFGGSDKDDRETLQIQRDILDKEKPDLVVMTVLTEFRSIITYQGRCRHRLPMGQN